MVPKYFTTTYIISAWLTITEKHLKAKVVCPFSKFKDSLYRSGQTSGCHTNGQYYQRHLYFMPLAFIKMLLRYILKNYMNLRRTFVITLLRILSFDLSELLIRSSFIYHCLSNILLMLDIYNMMKVIKI